MKRNSSKRALIAATIALIILAIPSSSFAQGFDGGFGGVDSGGLGGSIGSAGDGHNDPVHNSGNGNGGSSSGGSCPCGSHIEYSLNNATTSRGIFAWLVGKIFGANAYAEGTHGGDKSPHTVCNACPPPPPPDVCDNIAGNQATVPAGYIQVGSSCYAVPTASLTATPSALQLGQPTTLAWSSTDADSCTGSGFSTGGATSGSVQGSPSADTSYSVTCTGQGGTASDNASVTVAAPTATLNCAPNPIEQGASCTMMWGSTNAVSCTGSGFVTGNATSGSTSVSPWTTSSYSVTCTNAYNNSATANETVNVLVPTISASANPPRVVQGQSAIVTWEGNNVRNCSLTNTETKTVVDQKSSSTTGSLSGNYATGPLGHDASFLISCKNSVNTLATSTLVVPVAPNFNEF